MLGAVGAAVALAACDSGKRSEQKTVGPAILIRGISVGPDRPMPADGVITIAFDRYLLPSTIVRQSYLIADGNNAILQPQPALQTNYDPIARTVTIAGPQGPGNGAWLTPGQVYKLVLGLPEGDSDLGGFRAIDRATLEPNQNRFIAFVVGPEAKQAKLDPDVDFCADVMPLFTAKCANTPTCHASSERAASSLVLGTTAGIANTALNRRVAEGSNTAARAFFEEPPGRTFGVNMPLVTPGDPGSSWLLYKVELARLPTVDTGAPPTYACTPPPGSAPIPPKAQPFVPMPGAVIEATDPRLALEREVLNDYVLGREMPYPIDRVTDYASQALTFQEREQLRIWIARGAPIRECGGCGVVPGAPGDAGTPDASDAGAGDAADQ